MQRAWWLGLVCLGTLGRGYAALAQAAGGSGSVPASATAKSPAAVAPARKTCVVNSDEPNPAEEALNKKLYSSAEALFRAVLEKNADPVAHEGLIRALIAQDKVSDASKDAEAWVASGPGDSMALTALGEVRLRQGSPRDALVLFERANLADLCNARTDLGIAEVEELAGLRASAKKTIDRAYSLHPTADDIHTFWIDTLPRAERLQKLSDYAEQSKQIADDDRAKLKTRLEKQRLYHAADCRMAANSPREATVPMVPAEGSWGLNVKFNGKTRNLEIDTGASGITISRAAAMTLGIRREDETKTGGIGDKSLVKTSIAHVASVRVGGIEFNNCPVEILEKWSVLDSDGLIGGDVFDASLLTLDFPKRELRIAPLPLRPGETEVDRARLEAADDDTVVEPRDAYVAPEMAKWERIYRSGHELLIPTGIVETKQMKDEAAWKDKLFILDTGASTNLISPAAAREVTKVSRDYFSDIRGIQGEVDKVFAAGKFTLSFGGLRLDALSMTSIDTTSLSHDAGVEVSGLIGAPTLYRLVLHIDYRDNLVWCEYKPQK